MAESRSPAGAGYQLPKGTYRGLIVKKRLGELVKKRAIRELKELRNDPQRYLRNNEAEGKRQQHADEQERLKVAKLADDELAAGKPIVVPAWQILIRAPMDAAAPSWLTDQAIRGAAATVRVFADDTCEPTS
jgi:hypothetical protein